MEPTSAVPRSSAATGAKAPQASVPQPQAATKATVNIGGKEVTLDQLERALANALHESGDEGVPNRVELGIDQASGRVYGRIVDPDTGDVVDQLPPDNMLKLIARTREILGPIVDKQA